MTDLFAPHIANIGKKYPVIGQHLGGIQVQYGNKSEYGGMLEFFPANERDNPNYGTPTIEIYDKGLKGDFLENAIAGDALHHLGMINPSTGKPNEPGFYNLKEMFRRTITPRQIAIDTRVYEREVDRFGFDRVGTFNEWFNRSRLDAYIRGYLFPDKDDDWRKSGAYTKEQAGILEGMQRYLSGGQ